TRFLNVTGEVSGLAKVGPIRTQSDGVMAVLRSSLTAIHLVTVAEEMPVQETVDAATELRASGLAPSTVLVNMTSAPLLPADALAAVAAGRLDRARLAEGLRAAGVDIPARGGPSGELGDPRDPTGPGDPRGPDARLLDGLSAEASDHARRYTFEERNRQRLADLGLPTYELPLLAGAMDLAGVYELAGRLREQGVGPGRETG
ncbi:MAG TPA: hypothetical protein VFX70_17305, partial [Mycobacteriales bacterium]|nr:hypothetical protein [Mycobacteriales bacterium]